MPVDPRILDRFRDEFELSKSRQASAQTKVDELTAQLTEFQSAVTNEQGIQQSINEVLSALGLAPLA